MKGKGIRNKVIIVISLIFILFIIIVIPLWGHMSQYTVSGGPHIQMVVNQDRSKETAPNGYYVGANFIYNVDGEKQHFNIPSLQGLWQLDETYAEKSTIEIDTNVEDISVFCAIGKLKKTPNDIMIARFDESVMEGEEDSSPEWSEGEEVSFERHGNFYRIHNPKPGIYVARTVWNDGVLENAWVVKQK